MDRDPGAHRAGVGRIAHQADRHPRRTGIVAQHQGGRAEAVDHHVEIAIPVQIARRHPVGNVHVGPESPARSGVLEGQVTAIAEGAIGQRQRGELPSLPLPRHIGEPVLQPLLGVGVHHVPRVPGRDQEVLPPIEVHVQEQRAPRPSAGLDPREFGELREAAIAAIEEQGVALQLKLGFRVTGTLGLRGVRGHLGLEPAAVVAEHVRHEQVGQAVGVDVPHVGAHGGVAHLPLDPPIGQPKVAGAVIEPEEVGILEVVGDVQVGRAIAVEVGKPGAERKRLRGGIERPPIRGPEPVGGHRHRGELPARIEVERVGLGAHRQVRARPCRDA